MRDFPNFESLFFKFQRCQRKIRHDTGDLVLKMVARTLIRALCPFDLVGCWGGEEFIAVANILAPEKCAGLAERLGVLVEKLQFSSSKGLVKVTISVGATTIRPDDTLKGVVKRADRLMYQSKNRGKKVYNIRVEPSLPRAFRKLSRVP